MSRFIALLWDHGDTQASASAAHMIRGLRFQSDAWQSLSNAPGMEVLAVRGRHRSVKAYHLSNSTGVILGTLFRADGLAPPDSEVIIDDCESCEIASSGGQHLIRRYWGGYVAFLRCPDGMHYRVIRDCSGRLTCYWSQSDRITVVFSDVNDFASASARRLTIDPHYIAAFLYSPQLQVRPCGLNGVNEILAGDCLEVRRTGRRQFSIWSPRKACESEYDDEYRSATARLRSTTQQCIDAWASEFEVVLHNLSGGFDSAVVLGCLARSPRPPKVTCVNRFSPTAGDDERHYARLAARTASVTLLEEPRETEIRFGPQLFAISRTPKPLVSALFCESELRPVNLIATRIGAQAMWSGEGGDDLFISNATDEGAIDYALDHGIGPGLLDAIRDASRLSRKPYLSILRKLAGEALGATATRRCTETSVNAFLVKREALPADLHSYIRHPWAEECADLPIGKRHHALALSEAVNRNRLPPRVTHAPPLHPLLSQPIMEFCLRTPTYLLLKDGRRRGLARSAFSGCVPEEILGREDKGAAATFVVDAIIRSEAFIQQILLDGFLVRSNIIDRAALDPFLTHKHPLRREHIFPLLSCITAEIWAHAWTGEQAFGSVA